MAITTLVPGLREFTFLYKIGGFFKKALSSKWLYVALAFLAIGGGTFLYLKNDKENAVEQATAIATEQADTKATLETLQTEAKVNEAFNQIDAGANALRVKTTKDYENVRTRIEYAPIEQKEAPVPPLIIDTLNELDRLRALREGTTGDATGVRGSEVPAG